jgi:hypothetical protein
MREDQDSDYFSYIRSRSTIQKQNKNVQNTDIKEIFPGKNKKKEV